MRMASHLDIEVFGKISPLSGQKLTEQAESDGDSALGESL